MRLEAIGVHLPRGSPAAAARAAAPAAPALVLTLVERFDIEPYSDFSAK